MSSGKRTAEEAQITLTIKHTTTSRLEAQITAEEAQITAARLEEETNRLHELQRMLDKKLQELLSAEITLTIKIAEADSVEREKLRADLNNCQNVILRVKAEIAEIPEVEIRSQIRAKEALIQELSIPTYIDRVVYAGSPSTVEREGLYKTQTQVPGQPLYQCCWPADAQPPLPVLLAHRVFGEFLDDFNNVNTPLCNDECNFVLDLCFDVLGRMQCIETEAEFQMAFNLKMEGFLGHPMTVDTITCRTTSTSVKATANSTVRVDGECTAVGELKLEKGMTLAQVLQYAALNTGSLDAKTKLLPRFLVEVIGPTIRIGACVFFEKVAWQPLTPFLNCFYTEHDRTDMATLCRAMRALRKGVSALGFYYKGAQPSVNTMTPKDVPYPLQGRHSVRIGNKLVFIVTLGDGECRIFKYCRQYGELVHRSWAQAGLAPFLHHCKPIPGGWLEVEMQYLADWSPSSSLLEVMHGTARDELRSAISRALEQALAIAINGCQVAHGDMRPPNIMIKRLDGGGFDIKFIDFDWAGKVGVARYPPFINTDLQWHQAVGAGQFLAQDHDRLWMSPLPGEYLGSKTQEREVRGKDVIF